MWQIQGFKTKAKARKYQKENGGCIFSNREKEYEYAAQAVNLDTTKYPYIVRIKI